MKTARRWDSPWYSDGIILAAALVAMIGLFLALQGNVEWGAGFSSRRLQSILSRGLAWTLLVLVLLWILSTVRMHLRLERVAWQEEAARPRPQVLYRSGRPSWVDPDDGLGGGGDDSSRSDDHGGDVPRQGPATAAPAIAPAVVERGPAPSGSARPVFTRVAVDAGAVAEGGSVQVSWEADGADEVFVDGVGGFRPKGVAHVVLHSTRDVVVRAVNEHGHDTRSTGLVQVLVPPRITSLTVPGAPPIRLHADVHVRFDRSVTALSRLDSVMDMQAVRRSTGVDTATSSSHLRSKLSDLTASLRSAVPTPFFSRSSR